MTVTINKNTQASSLTDDQTLSYQNSHSSVFYYNFE